jgi:hypothetical protein
MTLPPSKYKFSDLTEEKHGEDVLTYRAAILILWALFLLPRAGHADGIIPYMVVPFGQTFLFPVVVLIEAVVLWRMLGNSFYRSLVTAFLANLASTVAGVALYFISTPILGDSMWNLWRKYHTAGALGLSIAIAVVLYSMSWALEKYVISTREPQISSALVSKTSAIANLVTYVPLLLLSFPGA